MKYIAVVALMLNHRLRSNALVFTEFQWGFSTWTNGWLIVQVAPADRHTRFRTYSRIPISRLYSNLPNTQIALHTSNER
jgi:hypothetical protein